MNTDTELNTATPRLARLLTVRETCQRLSISRSTFYQLINGGKLPLRKIGGASRVRSDELDAYIKGLPTLQPQDAGDTK